MGNNQHGSSESSDYDAYNAICGEHFDYADKNGDGYVDAEELLKAVKPVLIASGINPNNRPQMQKFIASFVKLSGAPGGDRLSRVEYITALKATRGGHAVNVETRSLASNLRLAKALDSDIEGIRARLRNDLGCKGGPAHQGNLKKVLDLLNRGAYVDAPDGHGWTGLMRAATTGHAHVVQILLDNGAFVDHQSQDGFTALIAAASNGHRDVVGVLLDNEASTQLKDFNKKTAFDYACYTIEALDRSGPPKYNRHVTKVDMEAIKVGLS